MESSPRQAIEKAIADGRLMKYGTVRISDNSISPFPANFSQILLIPRDSGEADVYVTPEAIIEDTRTLTLVGRVSAWQGIEGVAKTATERGASDRLLVEPGYAPSGGEDIGHVEVYAL